MNGKWWLFLPAIVLWIAVGFAITGLRPDQKPGGDGPPAKVDRIVCLAPNLTEIVFSLGLEAKIVGVTLHSDWPAAAAAKPRVGTFWQPNIESIIAARPDLVVALGFNRQRGIAERLNRIGCNCLTVNIEKVDDLFKAIEIIGAATGRRQQASELVSNIRTRLSSLSSLTGGQDRVRVLWVVQREPLRVAGANTFINEMIQLAGGQNAVGPTIYDYPPIGAEQVIACRPDVIIEPAMPQADIARQQNKALDYWGRFGNVPAVEHRRVYVIPSDVGSRLGPRLHEGVEIIARCLRPELFEDSDD
jgi:iron complex transport system substrate-binding protein